MAQRILGLDLGAAAVKAVLLESTFRGFDVLRTATVPLPPPAAPAPDAPGAPAPAPEPPLSRHGAALKTLLEGGAFAFDTAVASFPGAAVSTSVLTLPFTDPRRIEQTVPFEVEGQIPFELDEVAWDYQPLGTRDGGTDLLVAVARREELGALLAALAGAGVDPRAVVPAGVAYGSLLSSGALGPAPEEGAPARIEAVVDLGAERTSVGVFAGGACEAARAFAFGSSHLARALSQSKLKQEKRLAHAQWELGMGEHREYGRALVERAVVLPGVLVEGALVNAVAGPGFRANGRKSNSRKIALEYFR